MFNNKFLSDSLYLLSVITLIVMVIAINYFSVLCSNCKEEITSLNTTITELNSINDKLEQRVRDLEATSKLNQQVFDENAALRETIKKMSYKENVSRHGTFLRDVTRLEDMELVQDLGEWRISYYTPTKEECGSNSGITANGEPVIAGYTCAADTSVWPFGTEFYVEGWGLVKVADRGGAIKGEKRMDICLNDRNHAFSLGIDYRKVWLVRR